MYAYFEKLLKNFICGQIYIILVEINKLFTR